MHQVLRHLIPVLPPSNGLAVIGGPLLLIWQGVYESWSWQSLFVLGFWTLGQGYIFLFGRIASAIRDVWRMPSNGPYDEITRGVEGLIRQHRNGLVHAAGVVGLELALIVFAQLAFDPNVEAPVLRGRNFGGKISTGCAPYSYFRPRRVERARSLLVIKG